jgi:3-hydroxyisobutyrate dehydrogenase
MMNSGQIIGFAGLGNMGEGMAANLRKAGFQLVVRDVRPDPVNRLVAAGAEAAHSNHELGARSEVVCAALFDEEQIRAVLFQAGDDAGLIAGMRPDGVIIVHSTVSPGLIKELAVSAAEAGLTLIDAAMTGGGDVAARAATLTFMVGGPAEVVEHCRPVLEAMSQKIFHVGPLGSGVAAKILSNFFGTSHVLLTREAIRLGRAAGIPEEKLLEIVNAGGVGSSWVTKNWTAIRTQEENYTTGKQGMVAMLSKDLHLADQLARETGTSAPTLAFVVEKVVPELGAAGLTR